MNKCPNPTCGKDINLDWAEEGKELSDEESPFFYKTIKCKFCSKVIFYLYEGFSDREETAWAARLPDSRYSQEKWQGERKLIFQYPAPNTKINIAGVPKKIKDYFGEAERCSSIGAFNGAAACLRKCIYELCDSLNTKKEDYAKKITSLFPTNDSCAELTRQVKWLGDNHLHNNEEIYTPGDIYRAITSIPIIIRELYVRPEETKKMANALRKTNAKSGKAIKKD